MAGVNIGNVGTTYTSRLQGVVQTLNHKAKLRRMIGASNVDKWKGSYKEGKLHVGRSNAIVYGEDGGAFPVPDKQDYTGFSAYRKFVYASVQVTDGALATASGTENNAIDVSTSELSGLMTDIMKLENGFGFRDGSGAVTTLEDATLNGAAADVDVYDARMLWDGATYEVRDSAAIGTLHGSTVVSNVESAPNGNMARVNFSAAVVGAAANDYLVLKGCVNRAITGLDKLVDDSTVGGATFQGVTMATYPRYSSFVMSNAGVARALSPSLFRQMLAGIMQKSGEERPSAGLRVLCSAWDGISVEELYEGSIRMTPSDNVSGFAVAAFQSALGKIEIEVDTDCPYGKMFFVDFSKIYRGVQKELSWRRDGAGKIFQPSHTAGVYVGTAIEIADLYIKERNTSGKLMDLEYSIGHAY